MAQEMKLGEKVGTRLQRPKVTVQPKKKLPPVPPFYKDLAKAPLGRILQLVLWKVRHRHPELAVTITERDVVGYEQCTEYLQAKPQMLIEARPTYLAVRVADEHGDGITVVENNLGDQEAGRIERLRLDTIASHANLITMAKAEDANGIISRDTIYRLCDAITILART